MTQEELIEQLADKEHASWTNWMVYVFNTCGVKPDGTVVIPEGLVNRWLRQVKTPYAELSEQEKQSDRDEVAHILPIIEEYYPVRENPGPNPEPALPDMPNPTPEQIDDPTFLAIWNVIKSWDVNVPEHYVGYCGATGSHVMLIWNALKATE